VGGVGWYRREPIFRGKDRGAWGYSCSSKHRAGGLSSEGAASKSLARGLNHAEFWPSRSQPASPGAPVFSRRVPKIRAFPRRLLLQFLGSTITSDAGLLPYRELDDALGLTDTGAGTLANAHRQERPPPVGRLAAAIGIRAAGRLRGRERCREAVPRSGDALGGPRSGDQRACRPAPKSRDREEEGRLGSLT
jgi:hypothetical protein